MKAVRAFRGFFDFDPDVPPPVELPVPVFPFVDVDRRAVDEEAFESAERRPSDDPERRDEDNVLLLFIVAGQVA